MILVSFAVALAVPTEPPRLTMAEKLAQLRAARHPQTIEVLVEDHPNRTYPVRHPVLGSHGDRGWSYCEDARVPASTEVWPNSREAVPSLPGFQVLRVTNATGMEDPWPTAYSILLNPTGEAFVLCEDEDIAVFSAELRRAKVRIGTPAAALELAETFLSLLGPEYHSFVLARPGPPPTDPWHIDEVTSQRKILTEASPKARPPKIEKQGTTFVATLFTRSIYRRDVSRVEIRMTPDAHMTLKREFIEAMDTSGSSR